MKKLIKDIKEASFHKKIFWVHFWLFVLLTIVTCGYPYIWFIQHRSVSEQHSKVNTEEELRK